MRPDPHDYNPDPDWKGVCRCRLPRKHEVHSAEAVEAFRREQAKHEAEIAAGQAWHRRRTGET